MQVFQFLANGLATNNLNNSTVKPNAAEKRCVQAESSILHPERSLGHRDPKTLAIGSKSAILQK